MRRLDTYRATAKSLPSPSTSPKVPVTKSHKAPSIGYSDEQPVPGMDATLRLCPCGRTFYPLFPEQTRCQRCRGGQLTADGRRNDGAEIDAFNKYRDQWDDHFDDWQLHDPDRPWLLVWASDLAKRYREQTKPRPVRNNLRKWL